MRVSLKLFSYFLVGALAFFAVLNPIVVQAQEEPGVVTINLSSANNEMASLMPAGSTWTVSDGENTMSDTFAEGDLSLPTQIITDNAVPGGTYTVTINAEPTFELYSASVTVNGDSAVDIALTPVPVNVGPEPGVVTINLSSADASVASVMPEGSSWSVSDGVNSIGDTFAADDLTLPTTIVTNNAIPGGTYTATISAGPTFEAFSTTYTVDGDTNIDIMLNPVTVAPEPEGAALTVSTYACEGVTGNPVVLGEIGPDCTPISAELTFYLWGDETDDHWQVTTSETGAVTIDLPTAGGYDVVNEVTQTTVGVEVPAGAFEVAFGYPAFNTPVPDTGTITANVFHCLALETPGMLTEVGGDCIPGPAAFDFYMVGDGTDDSVRLTVGDDGVNSMALPVGEYEVYEVSTDTRLDNVAVTAGETSAFTFGIPRTEAPPSETGVLSVSTYSCEGLTEGVVLEEIGDDCVRISTDLSFYFWGDGTDTNWPLTTSTEGAVDHELPVGSYEVVDEATQWTFSATVTAEGSEIAFGIPASAAAPVDPAPQPTDPVDPAAPADPPVTGLPETGTGTGSNVGVLGALVSGALLAAGALGVRIRKS